MKIHTILSIEVCIFNHIHSESSTSISNNGGKVIKRWKEQQRKLQSLVRHNLPNTVFTMQYIYTYVVNSVDEYIIPLPRCVYTSG